MGTMAHDGTKRSRSLLTPGRPSTRALRLYCEAERLNARGFAAVAAAAFASAARELGPSPCRRATAHALSVAAGRSLARARIRRALARQLRPHRCTLRRMWLAARVAGALLCALVLLQALCDALFWGEIGAGAEWHSSSAAPYSRTDGHLPMRDLRWTEPHYFFHTLPERRPWLKIDLGSVRFVRQVEIVNRLDCCWARASALDVAVARSRDGSRWTRVVQRRSKHVFRFWRVVVRQPARWIRVRSARNEPLHLADVRVFG
jgi:hypothetical protein